MYRVSFCEKQANFVQTDKKVAKFWTQDTVYKLSEEHNGTLRSLVQTFFIKKRTKSRYVVFIDRKWGNDTVLEFFQHFARKWEKFRKH